MLAIASNSHAGLASEGFKSLKPHHVQAWWGFLRYKFELAERVSADFSYVIDSRHDKTIAVETHLIHISCSVFAFTQVDLSPMVATIN